VKRYRNITIALDEETAAWVRVEAARQDTSVSKLIAGLLQRGMAEDREYEPAMRSFLGRPPRALKQDGGYPRRQDLHERAGLR
jgi:hypothetical protein